MLSAPRAAVVSLLFLAACEGGSPTGVPPEAPSLRLVAGAGVADTVLTRPTQALTVEVRGEGGVPQRGVVVRFEPVPDPGSPTWSPVYMVQVGRLDQATPGTLAIDTTDERGRAHVLVRLGQVAGEGKVAVVVPVLGLVDTARYTILPGVGVRVSAQPRDTAVFLGGSYSLRAAVVDRFGNRRPEPVAFAVGTAQASLSREGVVRGEAYGRAMLVAHSGRFADTVRVSVVPRGVLAGTGTGIPGRYLAVMNLDGSGFRILAQAAWYSELAPAWNPSGSQVLYQDAGPVLQHVDMAGKVTSAVADPRFLSTSSGQYSRDGRWIYFSARQAPGASTLWRVRADGSGAVKVSPPVTGFDYYEEHSHPSPSPDGTRLAFWASRYGSGVLRVLDLATGNHFTANVENPRVPRWSPVSDTIAYVDATREALYVVSATAGGDPRRVSPAGRRYSTSSVSWSPDGKWLVARSNSSGLELVEVSTGAVIPLPFAVTLLEPAWRP